MAVRLASIPYDYLQAYPFAACVVESTAASARVLWGNEKWNSATRGAELEGVLAREGFDQLGRWLRDGDGEAQHSLALSTCAAALPVLKACLNDEGSSASGRTMWAITAVAKAQPIPSSAPVPSHTAHSAPTTTPSPLSTSLDVVPDNGRLNCRQLLATTDWSRTALGPRDRWSPVVTMMIDVVMRSPTQDALWLGPEFEMIYNDNYAQIVHHPVMFGTTAKAKDAWGPVWPDVEATIDRCLQFGESCHFEDDLLLYRRGPSGHFVEKYHTWSFVPLFDHDGSPLGLFNPTIETTASVLARRRQETLRDVSEQVSYARTVSDFYQGVARVLEKNSKDIPFMAFYSTQRGNKALDLTLKSSVGVPKGHPACPETLSTPLRAARPGLAPHLSSPTPSQTSLSSINSGRTRHSDAKSTWPIAAAISARQCVVMDDCSSLIQGFDIRQWDHLPESAIVVPIAPDRSSSIPDAVMVLGLNLQCPLDPAYEDWIHVLRALLTSALATVKGIEEAEARRLEREKMAKAQTAWFQGAAHDLRSPLTLVAGPLDDVLRTDLTPSQRQSLMLAQRSVSRVQRLVNALLDFSRIEAGRLTGRFVALDLGAFVGDIANLFTPAVSRKKVEYDVTVSHRTVWIDPVLMETAITNLLSNAVKYTKHGRIGVDVGYTETHAVIEVCDTGCGIPRAELESVTDRFNRATTALAAGVEGTGIGLALTKELIRIHDGELRITSKTADESADKSHGSTFTVHLPLTDRFDPSETAGPTASFGLYGRQLADEAMQNAQMHGSPGSDSLESDRAESFLFEQGDTLLVVDDNDDIRAYLRRIFAPYCVVVEAANGEEAMEIALANPPHLILSDAMMPRMNGSELLAAVRASPRLKHIPVVLLSAATDEELRLAALANGAEDFVLKPFKPKELLARVHLHMQLGKNRADLDERFAHREQELKLLSDYCPSGIIRADENGRVTYVNTAWREFCGMEQDEDPNDWAKTMDEATAQMILSRWVPLIAGEVSVTRIVWTGLNGRTIDGTFLRLDKAGSGGLRGVLGCLQDITHQEEKLHEAERRRNEAEEAKRQQELLVDMTSHEIRTPVSAILQCSSLVKENMEVLRDSLRRAGGGGFVASSEVLQELDRDIEALESIYQCGLVQERIAGDVLSLARIQLDMLSMHHARMDIRHEAQKTVSAFAAEAKMKSIDVSVDFAPSFDLLGVTHLKTDHVRLGQIVTNLISNAIRFTANSSVRNIVVRYDVSSVPPADGACEAPRETGAVQLADDSPLWLFVSVSDTGPGLTEHERNVLFQRFSQGNKMIHSQYGGSGLGLFICRKISELMGGRIEVVSELGRGSTFRFFIQTSASMLTDPNGSNLIAAVAAIGLEDPEPANTTPLPDAPKKLSVLIVEDNIINQTVLNRQLTKIGWKSDVASNGQEALDRLTDGSARYDAILMDLEMPIMDGITALHRIRQMEDEGTLPRQLVVALTGNAREAQIEQALAAGMDDVMIKPYRLPDLVSKLRRQVSSRRAEGDLTEG